MDAVVIVVFTINASLAHLLVEGIRFNTKLLFIVVFEVILDILLGILIGEMLRAILALRIKEYVKSLLLLLIGYSITHHWQVKLADIETSRIERLVWPEVEAHVVATLTPEALNALEIKKADAIVAMLDDDSNYTLCELVYEHFGTANLVARFYDREQVARFQALGVLTVDPSTAIINLLDHCVRSPSATSLLLGQEVNQDVIAVTVGNRTLHGVALRDLHLPADTLILSIRRRDKLLLSHGYTRLELGDEVTAVGTPESLEEVQWRFEP